MHIFQYNKIKATICVIVLLPLFIGSMFAMAEDGPQEADTQELPNMFILLIDGTGSMYRWMRIANDLVGSQTVSFSKNLKEISPDRINSLEEIFAKTIQSIAMGEGSIPIFKDGRDYIALYLSGLEDTETVLKPSNYIHSLHPQTSDIQPLLKQSKQENLAVMASEDRYSHGFGSYNKVYALKKMFSDIQLQQKGVNRVFVIRIEDIDEYRAKTAADGVSTRQAEKDQKTFTSSFTERNMGVNIEIRDEKHFFKCQRCPSINNPKKLVDISIDGTEVISGLRAVFFEIVPKVIEDYPANFLQLTQLEDESISLTGYSDKDNAAQLRIGLAETSNQLAKKTQSYQVKAENIHLSSKAGKLVNKSVSGKYLDTQWKDIPFFIRDGKALATLKQNKKLYQVLQQYTQQPFHSIKNLEQEIIPTITLDEKADVIRLLESEIIMPTIDASLSVPINDSLIEGFRLYRTQKLQNMSVDFKDWVNFENMLCDYGKKSSGFLNKHLSCASQTNNILILVFIGFISALLTAFFIYRRINILTPDASTENPFGRKNDE